MSRLDNALRAALILCPINLGVQPSLAAPDLLPLKRGVYAEAASSCDSGASYARYNAMLSFHGDRLNNSVTTRKIVKVRHAGSSYETLLYTTQSDGVGGGGPPERVVWNLSIQSPERFILTGKDHRTNWTGVYRYCGSELPH